MKNGKYQEAVIITLLFTIFGLFALQIPFSRILGSGVKFTLFDFFAPTTGVFLGTLPGIVSVLLMQIGNLILHGGKILDASTFIRLLPTLFAVAYFAKNGASPKAGRTSRVIPMSRRDWYWERTISIGIPVLAIVVFNLHPIGRSAWQYSLFWLIPIVAHLFRKNLPAQAGLFVRSLGATFTAHSVGSALWVWAFGLTREMWLALIPQTAMERTLMAAGISVFYLVFVNIFNYAFKRKLLPFSLNLEKQYLRDFN